MSHRSGEIKKTFDLGKYIITRLKKGKFTFEMIADPDEAWKAKKYLAEYQTTQKMDQPLTVEEIVKNPDISFSDIFPTYDIFNNVKKAEHATETDLQEAFQTVEGRDIAAHFILEGDFAWTKSQREEWMEKKKKQIITILARNSINPQTKKPHPPQRIEKALEEARVSIDLNKTAEEQVDVIVKQIQAVIPIRMETIQMAVKVPALYAAKAYNSVEKMAHIKQSEWQTDGSWVGLAEMPAGLQMEFIDMLNKLTHGKVQTKLMQN